jgi:hypothetical protein
MIPLTCVAPARRVGPGIPARRTLVDRLLPGRGESCRQPSHPRPGGATPRVKGANSRREVFDKSGRRKLCKKTAPCGKPATTTPATNGGVCPARSFTPRCPPFATVSTGGDDPSATVRVSEHNGNPVVQAGALNADLIASC